MTNKLTYTLVVCLLAFTITTKAQETSPEMGNAKPELVTDRPDQTEAATLVPKKTIQVETGFMFGKTSQFGLELAEYTYNTTLLRFGINEFFELRLIQEVLGSKISFLGNSSKVNGFSPLSLGAKIKVGKAKGALPETAFIGHITFPTGSSDFNQSHISGDFRFTMEWDLSDKFSMGINLGAETDGERPNVTGIYTFVVGFSPIDRLGFFVESYGFITEGLNGVGSPHDHRFNGGVTFMITDLIQYDVSAGVGLSESSQDYFISTGISFRIPR